MLPTINIISEKKLIGKHITMSFAENKTFELWSGFMPRRKEIKNNVNNELISMQVYDKSFDFTNFDIHKQFEKWAAIEVSEFNIIPDKMETYALPGGLYAVFIHKGAANTGPKTFQYIFGTWLPNSEYILDNRPHFEILGEKYKNEDPDSEEEIWIPIKKKE
ncbi:MAG: GyrI-like domain-containing protein [Bacteroidia bacterium]|nr:GyrI-like domain-containing protein [Bacteroidia bacterium]